MGPAGIAAGGKAVLETFREALSQSGVTAVLKENCSSHQVGCLGLCARDVLVEVHRDGAKIVYQYVKPDMVQRFGRDTGITARFATDLKEIRLSRSVCFEITRIVQEGLVNIRKHSAARNVLVRFSARDGFWTLVDPTDPEAVYAEMQGGYVGRVDLRTRAARDIQPKARYREKLRFNWNTPIHLSPNAKGTIYLGAQLLFRSRDRGDTWERISPDLTTNDPEKQRQEESGGITVDNSVAEMHTTVYSISESPKDGRVIWVGTDDGNVQLTRDGGKSWTNVAPNVPGLPKGSWVSWVEASRHDARTAYAAFDRHTSGDLAAYVYRTADLGKTWTRIAGPEQGLRGWAHVVKEDLVVPGILFVGTEYGLWVTVDGGKGWAEFKGGRFPSVAVRDIAVHPRDGDLVLATHGRGIWIVDDLTPLRALSAQVLAKPVAFLRGRAVQQRMQGTGGWVEGDAKFVGENPPSGAVITYYQRARHLVGPLELEILDGAGKVVDRVPVTKRRGVNRVVREARPFHLRPLQFAIRFAFPDVFTFVILRFAFADGKRDFHFPLLPVKGKGHQRVVAVVSAEQEQADEGFVVRRVLSHRVP